MADFLVALADFDRLGLWRELGHSCLFYYLQRELRLSDGAAHFRKVAARLIQRFPEVALPLREGKLCLTSIVELARVMTPENRGGCPAPLLPHVEAAGEGGGGGDQAGGGGPEAGGGDACSAGRDASDPGTVHRVSPGRNSSGRSGPERGFATVADADRAADGQRKPHPPDRVEPVPREAGGGPAGTGARPARRDEGAGDRGGARFAAGEAGQPPGGGGDAAEEPASGEGRPRDCCREAGGVGARRREMPMARGRWRRVRFYPAAGDRPRGPARARRPFDHRELSAGLPCP